jgi:deoxyguanosine kinase
MNVYLSIGSNKKDRLSYIERALFYIDTELGQIEKKSEIFKTESWGYTDSEYLNMCVLIQTSLDPESLLAEIKTIEKQIGRTYNTQPIGRNHKYQAREIDIDILFYEHLILTSSDCIIPHPKISERLFVLKSLDQIASDFIHPFLKEPIWSLLKKCSDRSYVQPFDEDINLY